MRITGPHVLMIPPGTWISRRAGYPDDPERTPCWKYDHMEMGCGVAGSKGGRHTHCNSQVTVIWASSLV